MYKKVELFDEPREILLKMQDPGCEITESEHGFLCGLLRDAQPKKVVEIGVSTGATTAVIMNCLALMGSDAKMYSVDLNKECYRRKGKVSGYQLKKVAQYLPNYSNHQFLLGAILPRVIDKIGGEIDFVVLDTVHNLPGELLDFLCIVPYLSDNAIVVLHDVTLNMFRGRDAYATKIVLDAAVGDKYFNFHDKILNIGALQISEETKKNIANVFSAFSITWAYMPQRAELLTYRKIYKEKYDAECLELFDLFVEAQFKRIRHSKQKKNFVHELCRHFKTELT